VLFVGGRPSKLEHQGLTQLPTIDGRGGLGENLHEAEYAKRAAPNSKGGQTVGGTTLGGNLGITQSLTSPLNLRTMRGTDTTEAGWFG